MASNGEIFMQHSFHPLFLSQSYQDAWDDYRRSLTRGNFARWDFVVLTASNDQQAAGYRLQLELRQKSGMLPLHTKFLVVPDPDGKRVGSGGATLEVLRQLGAAIGSADFSGLRILVIHSGGDSKRAPQYSALGKLFSPVPRELPNGRPSALFDEILISVAGVPARIQEGMLLLSGDVILLFNPLQIDFSGQGAAAISFKESAQIGTNHGVFLRGEDGCIQKFLHKYPADQLRAAGAVNGEGEVDIDTGAILFSTAMLRALYGLMTEGGEISDSRYDRFVNDTIRLSLYGDFLFPLATQSTLEQFYEEATEGCADEVTLREIRTELWDVLRPFRMKLLRLAPSKFLHFGTTQEVMRRMTRDRAAYQYLGWDSHVSSSILSGDVAGYCSVLSSDAVCGSDSYLEVSYVHNRATVGDNTLVSYVDLDHVSVPSNVILHGLKQKNGKFVVRILGMEDNPKGTLETDATLFSHPLRDFLTVHSIGMEELWQGQAHTLWEANLFPACDTVQEAVAAALNLYALAMGQGDVSAWRRAKRTSLQSGFYDADPQAIIAWNQRMQELVQMDRLAKHISRGGSLEEAEKLLPVDRLTPVQEQWLKEYETHAGFSDLIRMYEYLGSGLGGVAGEQYISRCFERIQRELVQHTTLPTVQSWTMVQDQYQVCLPLRVNWGGGWSDTPPYTNEHGGTVLNAAILLNGRMPVEVTVTRLQEHKIVFLSHDMEAYGEFTEMAPLQSCDNPYDPFALQKAALLVCGILPRQGGTLPELLEHMGGGLQMQTEVIGVPKGSGLGTSSILAAACVKALHGFFQKPCSNDQVYQSVLAMEQLMSTGGGWQDQVGGMTPGIKYTTSRPGFPQELRVRPVMLSPETMEQLRQRFCLIYTGQRRLARNLLRQVLKNYLGNQPQVLHALDEIQRVAALMCFELERDHVTAFGQLMTQHWALSQQIDAGSSNTLIEQIFTAIEDLIDGRMICGAGGGGFLQVLLKEGVSRDALQTRLHSVFQDCDIRVWDCEIYDNHGPESVTCSINGKE